MQLSNVPLLQRKMYFQETKCSVDCWCFFVVVIKYIATVSAMANCEDYFGISSRAVDVSVLLITS